MENLGFGIGLRKKYFRDHISNHSTAEWFEIIPENFLGSTGVYEQVLETLQLQNKPIVAHSLSMSLGCPDPLDKNFLRQLKHILKILKCPWFSDHLCFSSYKGIQYHDLLPSLRTKETLNLICDKIKQIQDFIPDHPFALENISYYVESEHHTISDNDFMAEIIERTGAYRLLDINNIYVNSLNFNTNASKYFDYVNPDKVIQIHLAGHWDRGDIVIDTHGGQIIKSVWDLYREFIKIAQRPVNTLIEWDSDFTNSK